MNIEDCIKELEFVSSIPKNHKPCFNTKTTISKNSWFVTAKRRWNGEKGEIGVIHISKIIDYCDLYYRAHILGSVGDNYENDINPIFSVLLDSLNKSIKGFDNLLETYSDQENVYNDYKNCRNKVLKLINKLDKFFNNDNIMIKSLMVRNPKSNFFNTDNIVFVKK